jgi:DNA-binding transcriptional LysR family regulator
LSDPLIAAVPASFAVKSDGSVDLSAIADFGLILSPETQGAMRARILYAVSKVNPSPRIVQEANVGLTMLSCVSAGLGVALLPRSVRVITFEGVRFCRITPDVLPPLEISVIWRPSSRPRLTDLFVQMIGAQTSAAVRRRGR